MYKEDYRLSGVSFFELIFKHASSRAHNHNFIFNEEPPCVFEIVTLKRSLLEPIKQILYAISCGFINIC